VREYDLIADWYSNERIDQTGVPEASALSATLSPASLVLDVGCGNGVPITRALLDAGHHIVGLDSSAAMLDRFRGNLPRTPAVRAIVEYAPFADASFDAAIAWGMLFHLTVERQRRAIEEVSRVLRPRAPFLFTAGGGAGHGDEAVGVMNGVTFHYYVHDRSVSGTARRCADAAGRDLRGQRAQSLLPCRKAGLAST